MLKIILKYNNDIMKKDLEGGNLDEGKYNVTDFLNLCRRNVVASTKVVI